MPDRGRRGSDERAAGADFVMVTPSFWPATIHGGSIYADLHLARGLVESGCRIHVLTTDANRGRPLDVPRRTPTALAPGFDVTYFPEWRLPVRADLLSPAMALALWREAGRARVLLARSIFNLSTLATILIGSVRGTPVVVAPHGALAPYIVEGRRRRLKRLWLGSLRPFLNRLAWHATSGQEADEIRSWFPQARVVVVPNGLDLDEFRTLPVDARGHLERHFDIAPGAPVVATLGRLHPKKGMDILIRAFTRVRTAHPSATLIIAGPDEERYRDHLQACIDACGLSECVRLPGNVTGEDRRCLLAGADVFALPSHNENFGMVYAEALAAGTPIVASRATPWQAVEAHGCGHWVPNSEADTAAAILALLGGDSHAAGARGREWMLAEFDHQVLARRFADQVAALFGDRRGVSPTA